MPKLIRCDAGHVFDSEAHSVCPECVRLGLIRVDAASTSGAATIGGAAAAHAPRPVAAAGGVAVPLSWLIGGGAAVAVAVVTGVIVLRPSPAPTPSPPAAAQKEAAVQPQATPTGITPPRDILPPRDIAPPADITPSTLPPPSAIVPITPITPIPSPDPTPSPPVAPAPTVQPPPMFDPSKITLDKVSPTRSGWGALAYSGRTRSYGESWNWGSESQARQRAITECGGEVEGCKSAVTYRRRCGAIAADKKNGAWAPGIGDTVEMAVRDAFVDCARMGGNVCELVRASCSR